jgi:hypothetical protein
VLDGNLIGWAGFVSVFLCCVSLLMLFACCFTPFFSHCAAYDINSFSIKFQENLTPSREEFCPLAIFLHH